MRELCERVGPALRILYLVLAAVVVDFATGWRFSSGGIRFAVSPLPLLGDCSRPTLTVRRVIGPGKTWSRQRSSVHQQPVHI